MMGTGVRRGRRARVAVVTGSRAEYGLLRSSMLAIRRHPSLRLQTVVVGMHLVRRFGHTVDRILADGFRVDARVKMQRGDDNVLDQARGLSKGIAGMAAFFVAAKTDLVVVLGDRIEAMAGALAAVTTGRRLAHVHGGDVAPGDFDDALRHSITKLADVHLTATRQARARVIAMGEPAACVHWVGAPGLDDFRKRPARPWKAKRRSGRALIVQHAFGRSPDRERRTMTALLQAVERCGLARTIVYPNTDRGHAGILDAIEEHRQRSKNGSVEVVRSLDRGDYLRVLVAADVLVGNSSSGIIEAAAAGTPTVNVGNRQRGRERNGHSVIDVGESFDAVQKGIREALRARPLRPRTTIYGDGRAGPRIASILARLRLD